MPIRGTFLLPVLSLLLASAAPAERYESSWPDRVSRVWIGPDFWANRLQDWRIRLGRLECSQTEARQVMRTAHLLTADLGEGMQGFQLRVRLGALESAQPEKGDSWSGFLVGAGHGRLNYRAAALVHHYGGEGGGLIAAIDDAGFLVLRSNEQDRPVGEYPVLARSDESVERTIWEDIQLQFDAQPVANGEFRLTLTALDTLRATIVATASLDGFPEERLRGGVALVSHGGFTGRATRYWFRDFTLTGEKVRAHPGRSFGPILGAIYSVSDNVLKMTVQMPPLGFADSRSVKLYTRPADATERRLVATADIIEPGYTAHFRVEDWDSSTSHIFGVRYGNHEFVGHVPKDPVNKKEVVVAGFTGNQVMGKPADGSWGENRYGSDRGRWTPENLWFPHAEMMRALPKHDPDLLVFTGDQIYEGGNPTNSDHRERNPEMDYLYKWFLWHWAYAPVVSRIPSVHLVDDHDVYQGDLWGAGGERSLNGNNKDGGYLHEPGFVNMVERTQCAHNPDPYDPTPIRRGIGVYYGAFRWGEIGFAIIEDRKFKSLPGIVKGREREGSAIVNNLTPEQVDVPGAKLLGDRQLQFLEKWVHDWRGAKLKVGLTQTIFASLHTDPERKPVMDQDSNGWPQSARNNALRILRKGHVFLLGGDTHLASVIHYGVDDWEDAGIHFCVPAVANKYRRWWDPLTPGENRKPGSPTYTGRHHDALGNKVTVHAIGNSKITPLEVLRTNQEIYRARDFHVLLNRELNADGYGIVRLNKPDQRITIEAWPWNGDSQMNDWPITVELANLYGRKAAAWLPTLEIKGLPDAVVQVIDEASGKIIYSTRAHDGHYSPKVFHQGVYTIRISDPDTGRKRQFLNLEPREEPDATTLPVRFD